MLPLQAAAWGEYNETSAPTPPGSNPARSNAAPPLKQSSDAFEGPTDLAGEQPMPSVFTQVEKNGSSTLTRMLLRSAQLPWPLKTNWLACYR
jgi:hypothetical protein